MKYVRKIAEISQEHTGEDDRVRAVALATDGSIIAVGYTFGSWARPNAGDRDFIAAKLFPNGTKSWRWQVQQEIPKGGLHKVHGHIAWAH